MKDQQVMNAERVAYFGKKEIYWNVRDGFVSQLLMEQQVKTVYRTSQNCHHHRC